jgi:glycosyltransferase involved in cell wall biosynthesis
MNIGVYLLNAPEEIGGGFTFEQEVLEGIIEERGASRHTFTAFSTAAALPARYGADIQHFSLTAPQEPTSLSLVDKVRRRLQPAERLDAEKIARESGIDILLNLVPWSTLTLDIPFITIVWDLMHRSHSYFPEVSQGRIWEGRERDFSTVLRRAAIIITGTQAGRQEVERFYGSPADRFRLLPHPTPRFALASHPENGPEVLAGLGISGQYLFYPAGFWPHKNHINLLLALAALRDRHANRLSLVLVGADHGNRSHIDNWIRKLGLESQVRVLGFLPREKLVALYRHAFALTYVSFSGPENFPPLEAFGLGCPVIASRFPGAEEQLGDAALLADPASPDGIADAIQTLSRDKDLRSRLTELGKMRARRFTTRDFARGLFAIFDELDSVRRTWGHSGQYT